VIELEGVKATRDQEHVLAGVLMERMRQDDIWGGADHDDTHTDEDWAMILASVCGGLASSVLAVDPLAIDRDTVQVMAVCLAWQEARLRRKP